MKREDARKLLEAWCKSRTPAAPFDWTFEEIESAFLSGLSAGLQSAVEITGQSTTFNYRNEEIKNADVVVRCISERLTASLRELEEG